MPKAFSPSSRRLSLQMVQRHWGCLLGAQRIPKGLELSGAKGYRSRKKKSPVWVSKPDSENFTSLRASSHHTAIYVPCNTASTLSHLLFRIDTSWWNYCSHLSSYPAMAERGLAITSVIKIFPRIIAESITEGYFSNLN